MTLTGALFLRLLFNYFFVLQIHWACKEKIKEMFLSVLISLSLEKKQIADKTLAFTVCYLRLGMAASVGDSLCCTPLY